MSTKFVSKVCLLILGIYIECLSILYNIGFNTFPVTYVLFFRCGSLIKNISSVPFRYMLMVHGITTFFQLFYFTVSVSSTSTIITNVSLLWISCLFYFPFTLTRFLLTGATIVQIRISNKCVDCIVNLQLFWPNIYRCRKCLFLFIISNS